MLERFFDMVRRGLLPVLYCRCTYGWFADIDGVEIRYQWERSHKLLNQAAPPWGEAFDDEIPF